MSTPNLSAVRAARKSIKAGSPDEALGILREALRRAELGPEDIEAAGRLIQGLLTAPDGPPASAGRLLNIVLLGQCTTSWLVPTLTATAWGQGIAAAVSEGGYDTILQDLEELSDANRPDAVVLLPWNTRLLTGDADISERVSNELMFWQQAWSVAGSRLGSRIIQIGFDYMEPGPLGYHLGGTPSGAVAAIRSLNESLRQALPQGAYFVDLEMVSGELGRAAFYDPRSYFWTKQPFSEAGLLVLANHLCAGLRAVTTGPKKVLVLDLDNTLWGGVVGETGPLGVSLGDSLEGEAYRAFQTYVKGLAKRGVVLAVASKNNAADAREPFEQNLDMVLKLDDFAAFEANWEPKGVTIPRMAQQLELGLDSFVFFDDNPAEREQARQALPEVVVIEVPPDPAEYVRALSASLWFETAGLTTTDFERAAQYTVERKRRELQTSFGSLDDYLRSLEMVGSIRDIDEADLQRVVQLLAKTNQFNLTTRRHTREEVLALLARPAAFGLTLRLVDRFGDYGLVGVVIAVPDENSTIEKTLRVDTWLMSCRVIGRTFEQFTCRAILDRADAAGYRRIVGEYLPTKKNALVRELYDKMAFSRNREEPGRTLYNFDLTTTVRPETFVSSAL